MKSNTTFKTKSFSSDYKDEDLYNKMATIRFISFESAIRLLYEKHNFEDKLIGYRVTEQGIEIMID